MKIKTTVYVYYTQYSWETTGVYQVFYAKIRDDVERTFVCEQEIELEVPDHYDPTVQKIASLQKEKEYAQQEFSKKVAKINESISKLQALEYTA